MMFLENDNNQTILKGQMKGVACPVPFFWPGSFSWKITVNYLASLEFGLNKYYQIKSGYEPS